MIIIVWLSEMLPSSLPGSRKEATLKHSGIFWRQTND